MPSISLWAALIPALAILLGFAVAAVRWVVQINRLHTDVREHMAWAERQAEAFQETRRVVSENTLHIADLIKQIDRLVKLWDERNGGSS